MIPPAYNDLMTIKSANMNKRHSKIKKITKFSIFTKFMVNLLRFITKTKNYFNFISIVIIYGSYVRRRQDMYQISWYHQI